MVRRDNRSPGLITSSNCHFSAKSDGGADQKRELEQNALIASSKRLPHDAIPPSFVASVRSDCGADEKRELETSALIVSSKRLPRDTIVKSFVAFAQSDCGADGGTRTRMIIRSRDFKSLVSTDSTTSACAERCHSQSRMNIANPPDQHGPGPTSQMSSPGKANGPPSASRKRSDSHGLFAKAARN